MRVVLPFFFLVVLVSSATAVDQFPPTSVTQERELEARNIRLFEQLPESIRKKVIAHLRQRLGQDFYRRLRFAGGYVADPMDFRRMKSEPERGKSPQNGYVLHFQFQMPEVGIAAYTAELSLGENGSVLGEIDLPAFAKDARKRHIVSLAEAIEIAKKHRIDSPYLHAGIEYDRAGDCFKWSISYIFQHDEVIGASAWVIEIDAHSGKALRVYQADERVI